MSLLFVIIKKIKRLLIFLLWLLLRPKLLIVVGQQLKKRESHALVTVLCIRLTANIFVVLNIVSKY